MNKGGIYMYVRGCEGGKTGLSDMSGVGTVLIITRGRFLLLSLLKVRESYLHLSYSITSLFTSICRLLQLNHMVIISHFDSGSELLLEKVAACIYSEGADLLGSIQVQNKDSPVAESRVWRTEKDDI